MLNGLYEVNIGGDDNDYYDDAYDDESDDVADA